MIDRNSIRLRIIFPLLIFIAIIMLSLLFIGYSVSRNVFWEYHTYIISKHSSEIKGIIDTAINELTTSQLLNKEIVVEAKKRAIADEIIAYWTTNNLQGFIETKGTIIYSSLDNKTSEFLTSYLPVDGDFHIEKIFTHIGGSVINVPLWDFKVVFIERPLIPFIYLLSKDTATAIMVPTILISCISIILITFLVLKNNLQRPLNNIISDVREGREVRETGVKELDIIGNTIKSALKSINRKTEQYQTLHNIATSIHASYSIDETLNIIIDKAKIAIRADLTALGLYTEEGKFKKLITRGEIISLGRLPEGKGILEFMRLSLVPVRIDDVVTHPAFSGRFPENHPVIKNLLGYPIFTSDGRPIAALYFANKLEGFTEEDEFMIKAICADAAIAIERAENISDLKKFKTVIDSAFDIIVITDEDGHILYTNPAFETLTGYTSTEVINKKTNILKSGYHDIHFYDHLWKTIKSGNVWKGEFINKKKNGEIYYASAVIFPVRTEDGLNYVSIQRDVTQEKKLYEQLLRAQKMEAIGTLAGGIAHDFNNLLAAILGYSELLLEEVKEGDQLYKPLSIIHNAALRGGELANKILTVTRKEKMEIKVINMNEIIRNSLDLLRRSIPLNIEIITNLKENLPFIKADPAQMQQVIMNLAVNARDAMPEGGRLVIETDTVSKENGAANGLPLDKGGFLKLSVSDTGTGIDAETQRRIFDPFFTTKETGKGTGLGLYIVHSIITNHGGYINLYSEPGKGTRFNIYIPVTGDSITGEESLKIEDIRGEETILIIDDESNIRSLCRDMLEPLGYNVIAAEDGNSGIQIFREMKDKIAVVILDMIMPKMGGGEVFQILKTIKPDVKVILCSGYNHNGFAGIDKLIKDGAIGFIQKPFTRITIGHAIRKAITGQ
ncbi:MAG: ATP-binding protein [Thermodesulfovibrionales bacterium]